MDIRTTETLATSGLLRDSGFRINPALENVSLDYAESDGSLAILDTNLNYSILPWQLGDDLVKKVFLTYNGFNCETDRLMETIVYESADGPSTTQLPGYNNSNEWHYSPKDFRLPTTLLTMTDPNDFSTYPYDVSQGYTVIRSFLTSLGTALTTDATYTAFHRYPTMTQFQPSNVEGNKVYTDGWYTSYTIACKTWNVITTATVGQIVYYPIDESFYINLTGNMGVPVINPGSNGLIVPDLTNWRKGPTFDEWQVQMRLYASSQYPADVSHPLYFIENQHLVTADLNKAILKELKGLCSLCTEPTFGVSQIDDWIKLTMKRLGAWEEFSKGNFLNSQRIMESVRSLCYQCLYHKNCLTK